MKVFEPKLFTAFKGYKSKDYISDIVAGTKYRGEFEEKLKKIIKKIKNKKDIIVFVDEIHGLVGAGGAEGAIDASNILKPYLSSGEINCIGATTFEEYNKSIEKEKAFQRRFQVVKVAESSVKETTEILLKTKDDYERFHNIKIDDESIKEIVNYLKTDEGKKLINMVRF